VLKVKKKANPSQGSPSNIFKFSAIIMHKFSKNFKKKIPLLRTRTVGGPNMFGRLEELTPPVRVHFRQELKSRDPRITSIPPFPDPFDSVTAIPATITRIRASCEFYATI